MIIWITGISGVGKTTSEIEYAVGKNILLINAESKSEIIEIPNMPGGSTSNASKGYAISGFSGAIYIYAYSPAVIVSASKTNQNPIDKSNPFFAFFGLLTAEHL